MAVTARRRGFSNDEKRRLRSVSCQFGPGLLTRMENDETFMDNVRVKINTMHFLDDIVKDQNKRQENVAPIVHDMAKACTGMISQAEEENGLSLPKEAKGWVLKDMMLTAFVGFFALKAKYECEAKGGRRDA